MAATEGRPAFSFSAWERSAVLTDVQIKAVSESVWRRPTVDTADQVTSPHTARAGEYKEILGSLAVQDAAQSSHKFYKWLAECEADISNEKESKYRGQLSDLCGITAKCEDILQQIDHTLSCFDKIITQQQTIGSRAQHLSSSCDRIMSEKDRLAGFESALLSKLAYFNDLDRLSALVHAGNLNVHGEEFVAVLRRLDECLEFLKANPTFADAAVFTLKFRQLQSRALSAVRAAVQQELQKAGKALQRWVAQEGASSLAGGNEDVVLATMVSEFKQAAAELRGILGEVEARQNRKEYAQLLRDCHALLAEARVGVLMELVQDTLLRLSASQPLAEFTRSGFHFLMQVTLSEHSLFSLFFHKFDSERAVALVVEPLGHALYDLLRPEVVSLNDIEALCDLVDIIKGEIIEDRLARYGDQVASMRPFAQRTLADTQERLIFCAQTFVRDEVGGYRARKEDLSPFLKRSEGGAGASGAEDASSAADASASASGAGAQARWFPTVERTLWALSKLYRSVDVGIFSGLAQEATSVCTNSILAAAKLVAAASAQQGEPHKGALDGQLFAIAHLLYFREQIAPFDAEFVTTQKELEFSHMREYLRRVLSGDQSLFALGAENILMHVASQGAPRVVQSQVDSKKELEDALKGQCEAFIMTITKLMIDAVLSFLAKATAARAAAGGSGSGAAQPLREHAFAGPERVGDLLRGVRKTMLEEFPKVVAKARQHLPQHHTRDILLRPIMSNVAEACSQVFSLLEAEYSPEEVAGFGFISAEELQQLFASAVAA